MRFIYWSKIISVIFLLRISFIIDNIHMNHVNSPYLYIYYLHTSRLFMSCLFFLLPFSSQHLDLQYMLCFWPMLLKKISLTMCMSMIMIIPRQDRTLVLSFPVLYELPVQVHTKKSIFMFKKNPPNFLCTVSKNIFMTKIIWCIYGLQDYAQEKNDYVLKTFLTYFSICIVSIFLTSIYYDRFFIIWNNH